MPDIKSCPFCDASVKYRYDRATDSYKTDTEHKLLCPLLDVEIECMEERTLASKWNTRAAPDHDTLVDRVEDLMKENAALTATLRDKFAMAALTGILSYYPHATDSASRTACQYADAMMEARKS